MVAATWAGMRRTMGGGHPDALEVQERLGRTLVMVQCPAYLVEARPGLIGRRGCLHFSYCFRLHAGGLRGASSWGEKTASTTRRQYSHMLDCVKMENNKKR